jgi:hypothetical protein
VRFAVPVLLAAGIACGSERAAPPLPHLELVEAPAVEDVAIYVRGAVANAEQAHKKLLVYVGAAWCEPCRHFHDAAAAGQLDATFGDLRMLVFDADRDKDALQRAGYISNLIPLFAVPRADGTASGKQIEGSIKGDGAVAEITPRLQALVQ